MGVRRVVRRTLGALSSAVAMTSAAGDRASNARRFRSNAGPDGDDLGRLQRRSRRAAVSHPHVRNGLRWRVRRAHGAGFGVDWESEAIQAEWDRWIWMADADGASAPLFRKVDQALYGEGLEGEAFLVARVRRIGDGTYVPLAIQTLPGTMLDRAHSRRRANGNRIRDGIEYGPRGNRVAYWFHRSHPGTRGVATSGRVRVRAAFVHHVYHPEEGGQSKGVPAFDGALDILADVDTTDDAAAKRIQAGQLFGGFIRRSAANAGAPLPGTAVEGDEDDETDEERVQRRQVRPATWVELDVGEEVTNLEPPDVAPLHKQFRNMMLTTAGLVAGVPKLLFTGETDGASDRVLKFQDTHTQADAEAYQAGVIEPAYRFVVRWFLQLGTSVGAWGDGETDAHAFVRPGRRYAHPQQEAAAQGLHLAQGAVSQTMLCAWNGTTYEQVCRDKQREKAIRERFGLTAADFATPAAAAAAAPPEDDDEAPRDGA